MNENDPAHKITDRPGIGFEIFYSCLEHIRYLALLELLTETERPEYCSLIA